MMWMFVTNRHVFSSGKRVGLLTPLHLAVKYLRHNKSSQSTNMDEKKSA